MPNTPIRFPSIIVSGGQTGADRAALDFAIEKGVTHAGWCPKGRKAEDGTIPARYNMQETQASGYPARTRANVDLGDATVIFAGPGRLSPGSKLTLRSAQELGRPCLTLRGFPDAAADAASLMAFLRRHSPPVLNIAGSRESKLLGVTNHVRAVLGLVFRARSREPVGSSVYTSRDEA